jgi:hypothetical protein
MSTGPVQGSNPAFQPFEPKKLDNAKLTPQPLNPTPSSEAVPAPPKDSLKELKPYPESKAGHVPLFDEPEAMSPCAFKPPINKLPKDPGMLSPCSFKPPINKLPQDPGMLSPCSFKPPVNKLPKDPGMLSPCSFKPPINKLPDGDSIFQCKSELKPKPGLKPMSPEMRDKLMELLKNRDTQHELQHHMKKLPNFESVPKLEPEHLRQKLEQIREKGRGLEFIDTLPPHLQKDPTIYAALTEEPSDLA